MTHLILTPSGIGLCERQRLERTHSGQGVCVGEFLEFYLLYEQQLIVSSVIPHHNTCARSVSVCRLRIMSGRPGVCVSMVFMLVYAYL